MSSIFRGEVFTPSAELGAKAKALLVVSEDEWNRIMGDVVVVPLYEPDDEIEKQPLRPMVGSLIADCTRVGSIIKSDLDSFDFTSDPVELDAVSSGVRLFLDLDTVVDPLKPLPQASKHRRDWWPRQGETYYGLEFDGQREVYSTITNDEWNVRSDYAAFVYITSKQKTWRKRWEIPVARSSYAIICDIFPFRYGQLVHNAKTKVPRLSRKELAAVARGVEVSLGL